MDNTSANKRIAKNTVYLYIRTILIMLVSLYTSRIILQNLGIEDFGVYNIVGGTIAMFGIVTNALSTSISRYITFELGRENHERLKQVFSNSLKILIVLSLIVAVIGETLGLWFLNTYLNIPQERMVAANWVWHCTIIVFIINLLSVPYNSTIIAHEHMKAYATISIVEVFLKLLIVYLLVVIPGDKLIVYSLLVVSVALIIRITYGIYCSKNFFECHLIKASDKSLIKEMVSFTGYSFLGQTPYILNTQGLNILINMFFGVTVNAARGIVHQVESAVITLVANFTVAIKPQITKSYASGDTARVFQLVCRGSKYSYFLMLLLSLPIIFEAEYILYLWLGVVPEHSVEFLRLALIGYLISMLGETGYTACQATGNIKRYTLIITSFAIIPLPLTWFAYILGGGVNYAYYSYILTYILVNIVRLLLMKQMLNFPPMMFLKQVVSKIVFVSVTSIIIPLIVANFLEFGFLRLFIISIVSVLSTLVSIWGLGLDKGEKTYILGMLKNKISRYGSNNG